MNAAWHVSMALLVLACSSAEGEEPDVASTGAAGAAGEATCNGRSEPLRPELVLSAAEELEVELVALDPEAPVVGDNAWLVHVRREGEPLEGADLSVLPWMPDHEHASTKTVQVSELEPGVYQLEPVFLGMVGYWEVGIEITAEGERLGSVSLDTCLSRE